MRRAIVAVLALAVLGSACSYRTRDVLPAIPVAVESSTIYASDGTLLHTFHAEENRKVVPLEQMPTHLLDAVVAIEDERFYRHRGVDVRAVLRAMRTNVDAGSIEQGGSTITQQYVKKVLLGNEEQTLQRKVEEASLALQLERKYTKDRILELYLNTIYFGNGAYGVEAAARQYFGVSVDELGIPEAALLAGLIQAPSRFDPYGKPEPAIERRNVVVAKMLELGMIDEAEAEWSTASSLALASEVVPAAEQYEAPYFVEDVKRWILRDERFGSTPEDRRALLFGGGLRIHTTVDLRMQAAAEEAVQAVLPDPAHHPSAALVALDPVTGKVLAMVGGRDFFGAEEHAKLNLATQGPRQAGSSFKPFVLAAALEEGIPINSMWSAPGSMTIPLDDGAPPWRVSNYDGGGAGSVTLAQATVKSYNTTFAQLILELGPEAAMEAAARYGVKSPLRPVPAAVLGANEVTALDMASGYATFANRGVRVPPVLVTRITRPDGTTLYEHEHRQESVLDPGVADTVNAVLTDAVEQGTGTRARIPGRAVAGKTGTAQQWRDAWFVGYTPQLVASVWIGFPQGQIEMKPPTTSIKVTGGSWPAEIWHHFASAALEGLPPLEFAAPPPPPTTTTTEAPPVLAGSPTTAAPRNVSVPDVVGTTAASAVEALRAMGFGVQQVPAAPDGRAPGTVVAQSPSAGERAPEGSIIYLEVVPRPADSTTTTGSGPPTTAVAIDFDG